MKNLLVFILALPIALGSLCHCQSDQHSLASTSNDAAAFESCIINDVKTTKPWEPPAHIKPTPEDANAGGGRVMIPWEGTFRKGVDDPKGLVVQAREGDKEASWKLQDYLSNQPNPDPLIRLECERMSALEQGIYGVAQYYGGNKRNRKASKDRRAIEAALRQIESEALKGNWIYSVALYQFLGSLNQTGEHLPWGRNEDLSARWLEVIYNASGKKAFDNVIANEVRRLGQRRNPGQIYYPHTPDGWNPGR